MEYLTLKEAAELLRVNPKTVLRAIKEGRLPGRLVLGKYLIPKEAVEELLGKAA